MDKVEFVARVRHMGWICYQMGADLPLHDTDEKHTLSMERLNSLMEGTKYVLEHPEMSAEQNHELWASKKKLDGYSYGEQLSVAEKTHPSLIPYEQLSEIEKRKDSMDLLMVKLAAELYDSLEKEPNSFN